MNKRNPTSLTIDALGKPLFKPQRTEWCWSLGRIATGING
jgi:hypothetical protein